MHMCVLFHCMDGHRRDHTPRNVGPRAREVRSTDAGKESTRFASFIGLKPAPS